MILHAFFSLTRRKVEVTNDEFFDVSEIELLGKFTRFGRKERKMTEEELSGQAGISRRTLQKIERGDPTCEIGLVFEVAHIVGVKLFSDEDNSTRYTFGRHIDDKLALLPKRIRKQ